jgi:hypothetical protein
LLKQGRKMKRTLLLILSITALVAALFLGTSAVMADKEKAGSQIWHLDGNGGGQADGSRQMVRSNTTFHGGDMIIYAGMDMVWVADQAAESDTTFSEGSWVLSLSTDNDWAPESTRTQSVEVEIGGYNPVSHSFYYYTTSTDASGWDDWAKNITDVEKQDGSVTINKGDYLVVRVTNNDDTQHTVYFNGGVSTLTSPVSDPGYACPEAVSGILLGAGLIGLVSYVALRRKKATAT